MLHAQALAMLRLRPWFLCMYCRLAAAAVAALDTTVTFRAPRYPTRVSDLPVFASRKQSKSRKQPKTALQDISNKASLEASTASGAVRGIKRNPTCKKMRAGPYPSPSSITSDAPVTSPVESAETLGPASHVRSLPSTLRGPVTEPSATTSERNVSFSC
ncbi:hypothetical protein C8R47DRAFT_1131761 [Mycena vitilis]|nr:hypothetical protein C8R47DRAFT_1131761 [Mycena vitilis]